MSDHRSGDSWPSHRLPLVISLSLFLAGCGRVTPSAHPLVLNPVTTADMTDSAATALPAITPAEKGDPGPFRFLDICPGSGIDFVHVSGMTAEKLFPTANGSGVALFDFDGDGKLDVYFATGNVLPLPKSASATNRLYKNLGGGKFRDETEHKGWHSGDTAMALP